MLQATVCALIEEISSSLMHSSYMMSAMLYAFGKTTEAQICRLVTNTINTVMYGETEGTNEFVSSLHAAQSKSRQLGLELWQ